MGREPALIGHLLSG